MNYWDASWLGALQGLTEFLPISSSGHLSLLQYFTGLEDTPRFFDLMLHIGTLLAIVFYYRAGLFRQETTVGDTGNSVSLLQPKLLLLIILATIPAVAAGAIFRPTKLKEGERLEDKSPSFREQIGNMREYSSRRPATVISFLSMTGLVLLAGASVRRGQLNAQTMTWKQALGIGFAQGISALCPGLSRSGMTVSTGLMLGLEREWAVHFSLLMSIPAILGATLLKAKDADPAWISANIGPTLLGTAVSSIVGWFCITLLLRSVRGRWWWFSIYLWILAGTVAWALSAGITRLAPVAG